MAAGLIRRGAAFWLDVFVGVLPFLLALSLFGTLMPLDDHLKALAGILIPGVLGALGYVFIGAGVFNNTFGRYVFGVRVRALRGGPPSIGQALVRSLTLGLWPVEAVLVGFGKQKRRLGDRLAGTAVEVYRPARSAVYRGGVAALILVPAFLASVGAAPLVNARMSISRIAQGHLSARGIEVATPRNVQVVNDRGFVVFKAQDQQGFRVDLERVRGEWKVVGTREVDPNQIGGWRYSVQLR